MLFSVHGLIAYLNSALSKPSQFQAPENLPKLYNPERENISFTKEQQDLSVCDVVREFKTLNTLSVLSLFQNTVKGSRISELGCNRQRTEMGRTDVWARAETEVGASHESMFLVSLCFIRPSQWAWQNLSWEELGLGHMGFVQLEPSCVPVRNRI